MHQLENFALGEICIYVTQLEGIRILPGINLIDDKTYTKLIQHEAFTEYLHSGIFEQINIDPEDFILDSETNITIVQTDSEKIPIQNVLVNTNSVPLAKSGVFFPPSTSKKAGLPQELANRIERFAPPTGWVSRDQIREKLDLNPSVDLSKLPFPNDSTTKPNPKSNPSINL